MPAPLNTALFDQFITACAAATQALRDRGLDPLYKSYEYEPGVKFARIIRCTTSGRSSVLFMAEDGTTYRADGWKARGRLMGKHTDQDVINYAVAPNMASPARRTENA